MSPMPHYSHADDTLSVTFLFLFFLYLFCWLQIIVIFWLTDINSIHFVFMCSDCPVMLPPTQKDNINVCNAVSVKMSLNLLHIAHLPSLSSISFQLNELRMRGLNFSALSYSDNLQPFMSFSVQCMERILHRKWDQFDSSLIFKTEYFRGGNYSAVATSIHHGVCAGTKSASLQAGRRRVPGRNCRGDETFSGVCTECDEPCPWSILRCVYQVCTSRISYKKWYVLILIQLPWNRAHIVINTNIFWLKPFL